MIQAGGEIRDEAGRTEAVVEDLYLDLAAVSMSGESELNAYLCGARKSIGVVRKQNIGHVPADQRLNILQHPKGLALGGALALVVHTNYVERGATPVELSVFLSQQAHPGAGEQLLGQIFEASVDFMVAIATPRS